MIRTALQVIGGALQVIGGALQIIGRALQMIGGALQTVCRVAIPMTSYFCYRSNYGISRCAKYLGRMMPPLCHFDINVMSELLRKQICDIIGIGVWQTFARTIFSDFKN